MKPVILRAGDSSLLLRFGDKISAENHEKVRHAFLAISSLFQDEILNLHPAYASLLVEFDPLRVEGEMLVERISRALETAEASPTALPTRLVEIPVLYDGMDLEAVAEFHGLTPQQVIALHSAPEYTVHFLGFQPGFPYLFGLPRELETPRLSTPRLKVPAGSIAIAGGQAGIYPRESPGGWRLFGRTSRSLFTPDAEPPTLLQMGDRLRFRPVSAEEFSRG